MSWPARGLDVEARSRFAERRAIIQPPGYSVEVVRFEIVVAGRSDTAAGQPTARRLVLGRLGAVLASIAAVVLTVGVVVIALVLGYLLAGLVIASMLTVVLGALLRRVFRAFRP